MKAVNLIPKDAAGGASGRSGVAVHALLGALALLVAMSALYTLAGRFVEDKQRELASVTSQAAATESRAGTLKTYAEFSDMRKARMETVKNLVDSRFDWSHALREVARTLPRGTWILSLNATVNPTVGAGGTSDSLRAALADPAIELSGCAPGQKGVARTLTSLRRMAGVQRVSLSQSQKGDGAAGTADAAARSGCGSGAQFSLTIFFKASAAATAQTAAAPTGGTTP